MKVKASVIYEATFDIGDVPWNVIEELLKKDDGEFSLWEQGSETVVVRSVDLEEAK